MNVGGREWSEGMCGREVRETQLQVTGGKGKLIRGNKKKGGDEEMENNVIGM